MECETSPESLAAQVNDLQQQLVQTTAQLEKYATDLNRSWERERERGQQLEATYQQLQTYARDLKVAYDAEKRKSDELEQAHYTSLLRLNRAMRYKDDESASHIERLSYYAKAIALHLGLGEAQAQMISSAAPMHDIGKIGIPDAILLKKGPLSAEEWEEMKKHPALGASLLKGTPSPLLETAGKIALSHHERWDGSGYPQGLKGEAIPLPGRIIMIADQYDALRSPRPYKPAFTHERTYDIILNGDGRTLPQHFDPRLLEVFRDVHQQLATIYDGLHD
ncbi:MAG: HD domain-containing protein [Deltaproteobacteria bacterium]|nr:HD domain-containing protein [Deltaproteobacteria bacterium]